MREKSTKQPSRYHAQQKRVVAVYVCWNWKVLAIIERVIVFDCLCMYLGCRIRWVWPIIWMGKTSQADGSQARPEASCWLLCMCVWVSLLWVSVCVWVCVLGCRVLTFLTNNDESRWMGKKSTVPARQHAQKRVPPACCVCVWKWVADLILHSNYCIRVHCPFSINKVTDALDRYMVVLIMGYVHIMKLTVHWKLLYESLISIDNNVMCFTAC